MFPRLLGSAPRRRLRVGSLAVMAGVIVTLTLPGCAGPCSDVDGPGVDETLASAERWLRIVSPPDFPDGEGTLEVEVEARPIDAGQLEGEARAEPIAVHSWFVPGIEQALEDGDAVFVAIASTGLERETVSYVVARSEEGAHRLVGTCMAEGEGLLRERLGGGYDAAIDRVIGATDRERILDVLGSSAG